MESQKAAESGRGIKTASLGEKHAHAYSSLRLCVRGYVSKLVHIKTCVSVRMHLYVYIYILYARVRGSACVCQCLCPGVALVFCAFSFVSCCVFKGMGLHRGRDTDALVTASLVDVVGADERLAGATASLASVAKTPCGPINLMSENTAISFRHPPNHAVYDP